MSRSVRGDFSSNNNLFETEVEACPNKQTTNKGRDSPPDANNKQTVIFINPTGKVFYQNQGPLSSIIWTGSSVINYSTLVKTMSMFQIN